MTDIDTLRALRARVEAAEGPDREIDAELYRHSGDCRPDADGVLNLYRAPPYTASLDAAVALVERLLPDAIWGVDSERNAHVWTRTLEGAVDHEALGLASPALALIAALLKALIAMAEREMRDA